jgi:hypothetical protein
MAFSGGTFSRTFDCTTDRDNGVKILASKFDTELDGFATGLSTCILKDGTQTCTAAIPFAEGLTVPDNKTIILGTNSDITIQYDESTNDSLEIAANVEGAALGIVLKADQGDDNADQHKLNIADGGTLTLGSKISGSFVSYLTHTPNSTVASSTTAVAGNLTVGGDLTLGSGAVISEAELEAIDGVTAGTVAASKAVIVDSNKDISSFRNLTLTGELDAGSLDISGDADIDGTLEADAMTLNGTAITATATLDTGISNNNVPKFTSGVADDDFLRVAGTAIEGRSASEVLSDIGGQASLTFGISNTNAVKIDSSSVADDEYARFTANGLESRATSEVLSDIGAAPAAGSSNIVTTGALNSGSITSGFGSIDNGSSAITTTGVITGGTLEATADTSAGDNAAIGFTSAEGLILTGQGSTSDITLKNDADAVVFSVPTGTDDILFPDSAKILMGAGSDLQIYHQGSHSFVEDTGTGNLYLATNGSSVRITKGPQNAENMAAFIPDGAAILYYDNAGKLATTSTGVNVTGELQADSLDIDGLADIGVSHSSTDVTAANSNSTLRLGNSAAGNGIYNAIRFSGNQQDMYIMSFNNNTQADRRLGFFLGSVAGDATSDERLSILGNGNVGIGASSPTKKVSASIGLNDTDGFALEYLGDAKAGLLVHPAAGEVRMGAINSSGTYFTTLYSNASEAMRIDSGGNILINQSSTTSPGLSNTTTGLAFSDSGRVFSSASGAASSFNRNTSDGGVIHIRKAGTLVGVLSVTDGDNFSLDCQTSSHSGVTFGAANILPRLNGSNNDGNVDLGGGSNRFLNIYATNNAIQTSDETEKQNIASLTSSEITAAKAISKLFKTFKWKHRVSEEGDAARTHSGVIAQEVQTAMSDAGLDASKYAFWCSDTWTNDDGNEQTRLGIRYAELMSFIGAATEQRLADIETRLTALENA